MTTLACDFRIRREGLDLVVATTWTGPLRELLAQDHAVVIARELPDTTEGADRTLSPARLACVGNWVGVPSLRQVIRVLRNAREASDDPVICFMDVVGMLTCIGFPRARGDVILFGRGQGTAAITFSGRYPRLVLQAAEAIGRCLRRLALRRADYSVTVSSDLARSLGIVGAFVAPELDWNAFNAGPRTSQSRDLGTALFVGRLELEKGPELAIRAAAAAESITRLVVVGSGSLLSRLRDVAEEVRTELAVKFIPSLPHRDVLQLCQEVRVLLAPSLSEGFGLAPFEGLAMGAAAVASRVGGLPEAIGWSDRAQLVSSRTVSDWASAVESSTPGPVMTTEDLKILRESMGWWTLGEVLEHVSKIRSPDS